MQEQQDAASPGSQQECAEHGDKCFFKTGKEAEQKQHKDISAAYSFL